MLVPSGSYKYCSWKSKWLLTWSTRAFPISSFLDRMDSNNSGIFFTGPNSHNNRVSVKIGSEHKQTETEWEEKRCLTRAHARCTRPGRSLRARALRASSPRRRGSEAPGRAGRVRAPDACPLSGEGAPHQLVIDTCRSPVPPLSSARRPTRGGLHPLSCLHFPGLFPISIYFLPIFLSSNP